MGSFVHLHLHSEYSLLDGACRVSEIPKAAAACGHDAVAVTDHGAMYGAVAFYKACKKYGIKPIIGCEVYVAEGDMKEKTRESGTYYHLILLVKNETGYRNLIYLVSKGFSDGFYIKPRIDMNLLAQHSEGLVCLSACLAGYIPRKILEGSYDEAKKMALRLKNIFGKDNFYLEIQNHGMPEEARVSEGLLSLSDECGIDLVATNDVHYLEKSHAAYQDVLMCIQTNDVVTNERTLSFSTDEYYYKSTEEMSRLFSKYKGAIENTVKIADMCSFDFDFTKTFLPRYKCPDGQRAADYLRKLTFDGLADKVSNGKIIINEEYPDIKYKERIETELSVIETMGYSEYFLIVWDFVHFAKSKKISVGPGRGSGAASLVAFLIGITDIDPVRFDLIFESFLNVDRVSMPDFDIDFADNRREKVIEYVKNKYGEDHVSQIITFGTMSARAVVRDVGRALGMPYSTVDQIAKMIPRELGVKLADAVSGEALRARIDSDPDVKKLIDVSLALEGMPRHASTHAAGVVITDRPVYEYVPLATNGGNMLTQFDMDTVAELGLLKFDFLGIRFLTVIEETERLIRKYVPDFDIEKVPFDDEKTYRLICRGNTEGTFQLGSAGMRAKLVQMHPESFDDIIAAIALYRPGPMKAGAVDAYAENKHDRSKISYVTDKLAPVLDTTYGCLVYQEQVTQIFRSIGGYSFSKADNVRRAVKKKKADVIENERGHFIEGAVENGVSREAAEKIFSDIEGFSSYAFNKSHATAYAVTAYRTAYLKAHYLKEYYSALISSEMSYQEKVGEYISELKKAGIKVLPPDVNYSEKGFSVDSGAIRFGLLAISGVGRPLVDYILSEREFGGRYTSLDDFVARTVASDLNRRQYEMLVKAGALDSLSVGRSAALALTDKVIEYRASSQGRADGQMDLMSMLDESEKPRGFTAPDVPEITEAQKLKFEKESLGIYLSGSIIGRYSKNLAKIKYTPVSGLISSFTDEESDGDFKDGDRVTVVGIIEKITNKKTKRGDPMSFVSIDDSTGELECIVFAKLLSRVGYLLTLHSAIAVTGTVSQKDDDVSILADSIIPLVENESYDDSQDKTIYIKIDDVGTPLYNTLHSAIMRVSGTTPVVFYLSEKKKYVREKGLSGNLTHDFLSELRRVAGDDAVVVK